VDAGGAVTPLTDPTAREVGWNELQNFVSGLAARAAEQIGPPADRLRVEVFLPFDKLDADVDAWPSAGGTLGKKYRVVVRSYERAYEDDGTDETAEAWHRRWDRRPAAGAGLAQEALCDSWAELANPEFPAVAVAAADAPDVADLENLVVSGYPVAIITRGAAAGRAQAVADLALGPPTFEALPERVRAARRVGNHPAGAVSLLWDDPDRRPPDRRCAFVQPE
jgi:hypothetical protein